MREKKMLAAYGEICVTTLVDAPSPLLSLPPSGLQCRSLYYLLLFLPSPAEGPRGSCNVMTSQQSCLQFHPREATEIEPLQLQLL